MKRFAFFMLIAAVAAVAACQKQATDEPIVKNGSYVYTVNASIGDADVKSDYDADGKFSWSEGDAISVLFHNGDDNKFFTLTRVSGTGSSASFSGTIDDGYTIGASDGTVSDKKIWALFPASKSHSYTAGSLPSFFVEPETDLTAGFSANVPMYGLQAAEGDISFKNLCSGYKLTFTNIATTVNTVMVKVDNNAKTYQLSGSIPLGTDSSEYKLDPDWGDEGAPRILSYVVSVDKVNNNVVVYVPTRRATTYFQPVVDLFDYDTGNTIIHLATTTVKATPARGTFQPLTINTNNSTGTPPSFTSSFGITWPDVTDSVSGSSDTAGKHNNAVSTFKAKADASYTYIYFEIDRGALLTDASYEYANSVDVYFGNSESASAAWMWSNTTKYSIDPFAAWLTKSGAPEVNSWEGVYAGSGKSGGHAERWGKKCFYEIKLKRSYNACLQVTGTINIGLVINNEKYHGGSSTSEYLYVPSNGEQMLQITAPAYVAP